MLERHPPTRGDARRCRVAPLELAAGEHAREKSAWPFGRCWRDRRGACARWMGALSMSLSRSRGFRRSARGRALCDGWKEGRKVLSGVRGASSCVVEMILPISIRVARTNELSIDSSRAGDDVHVYTCIYLYVVNVMLFRLEPEIKKGFVDLIFSLYENLPREVVMRCNRMPCNAV